MKPLIDGDCVAYEIAYACEPKDEEGNRIPIPLDAVEERVKNKIAEICADVYATEEPTIYLTGKGNFRDDIATIKGYKENRVGKPKPHYLKYIRALLKAHYETKCVNGFEADDLMAMDQCSRAKFRDTIICSIDKDLRIVPGFHYSWGTSVLPSFGPICTDEIGKFYKKKSGKIIGTGLKQFYSQLLMGDRTDNIPGIPFYGPIKAFNLLDPLNTEEEMFNAVKEVYQEKFPDDWEPRMLEVGRLLWMTQMLDENGGPVLWEFPDV